MAEIIKEKSILKADRLLKRFGEVTALDNVSFEIPFGSIYGLVGSNGAGKSTFLRIAAGILRQTGGELLFRNKQIYDNPDSKKEIFLVPDTPWFLPQSDIQMMKNFYASIYPDFSEELFEELRGVFPLDIKMKLRKMSKGMQRQAALLLGLSARPTLLLMDEAFDGLDPVMRQVLKKITAREVADGEMTVIIASHNLRELEDFCDRVSLLHKGGLLCEQDINDLKLGVFKMQPVFKDPPGEEELRKAGLNILRYKRQKSVLQLLVKGEREDIEEKINSFSPLISDLLPLSLEEFFIYELGEKGYGIEELTGE